MGSLNVRNSLRRFTQDGNNLDDESGHDDDRAERDWPAAVALGERDFRGREVAFRPNEDENAERMAAGATRFDQSGASAVGQWGG